MSEHLLSQNSEMQAEWVEILFNAKKIGTPCINNLPVDSD